MNQEQRLNKKGFALRILLPTFTSIGLFIASFFLVLIPWFEEVIIDRKREMIRELTNSASDILEQSYQKEQKDELSRAAAQARAIEQIRNLRYGDEHKDYFWITDMQPKMIMHPYRQDLEQKDLANFRDSHGKRLFIEMAEIVKAHGKGYVDYMWQWKDDSTRIVPKLSYVKGFSQWGWIIGTGIYIEDVRNEIMMLESRITTISIGITVIISLLLSFITFQNLRSEKRRVQAEIELRESRERYRTLVEASTEGLIMILEGGQIYFNKIFIEMLGYSEQEEGSIRLEDLMLDSAIIKYLDIGKINSITKREKQTEIIETVLRNKKGDMLNVLLNISPISFFDKNGIVVSVKDMSTHKQIEEALDESKEKYLSLTSQLTIGVFRISAAKDGKFIEANHAVADIFGIEEMEKLLNSSLLDFFDNMQEGQRFFSDLSQTESIKNRIILMRRISDEKVFVSVSAVLVKNRQGKTIYCDGILEDITDKKRTDIDRDNLISELQTSLLLLNQEIKPFIQAIFSCDINTTLNNALSIMTKHNSDIILITSEKKEGIGVITDRDIRERALAKGLGIEEKVMQFMSAPLITINPNSSIFDALLKFQDKNVKHLIVQETARSIDGVVCAYDLQKAFHAAYLFSIQRIHKAASVDILRDSYAHLQLLVKALVEREASIRDMTKMTTIISGAIVQRLLELYIQELGPPPVKFAFMALGSEGRKEQTLSTDQDNAIIYEDVPLENNDLIQRYFIKLGERVCSALNTVGYKFCKGNIMAQNPQWCQPLSRWKLYITNWVTTASPQDLLDVKIFFDFRRIYGDETLIDKIREHVYSITAASGPFFIYLAESVLKWEPPDGAQKLKSSFDSKIILLPIIDLARVYALKHKIAEENTLERISKLFEKGIFSLQRHQEIVQIYNFLMKMRFKHQSEMLSQHLPIDNIIDSQSLSEYDAIIFKKMLQAIKDLKDTLSLDIKGTLSR